MNPKNETLYHVCATETDSGAMVVVPFFPMIAQQVAEEYAALMRTMIATGKERRYSEPVVVPCLKHI